VLTKGCISCLINFSRRSGIAMARPISPESF
jgi:hypothetical protein